MKIGNLRVKNRIFLAPMEEINDIAFRLLCKKAGAGLTYSPMTHPQSKQNIYLDDKPALQLFCTTTKGIKEFIKKHDKKVSLWDFNLGCPATTARKHGFGSYLKDLNKIEEILKTIGKKLNLDLAKLDLYLWYKEKGKEYLAEKAEIRDNKTLSYQQRKRLLRKLREADEELQYTLAAAPLGCGWCSNMMDDLVLEPKRQTYYCVACYEKVHRLYPDEYP